MPNRVTFEMDAKTESAVRGFLRVVQAQGTTEKAFEKTAVAAKRNQTAVSALSGKILGLTTALVGTSSLAGAFSKVEAEAQASTERFVELGKEMTSLLSLGTNLQNFGRIRTEVAGLSTSLGLTTQAVADARFAIESGAPNLSKAIQKALGDTSSLAANASGAELADTVRLLTKTFQGFGKELSDVEPMAAKLFRTAELGDTTFQQLAQRFPEIAAAARVSGRGMMEAMASVALATQRGGDVEKDMTATRNVLLEIMKAIDDGLLKSTGNLSADLEIISGNQDLFKKIFEKRTIGTAEVLVKNVRDLRDLIKQIQETPDDLVTQKLFGQYADPTKAFQTRMDILTQANNNRNAFTGPGVANSYSENIGIRNLGWKTNMPFGLKWLAPAASRVGNLFGTNTGLQSGLEAVRDQMYASGSDNSKKMFEELFGQRLRDVSNPISAFEAGNQPIRDVSAWLHSLNSPKPPRDPVSFGVSGTRNHPLGILGLLGNAFQAGVGPPTDPNDPRFGGTYTPPNKGANFGEHRITGAGLRAAQPGDAALLANLPGIFGPQAGGPMGNNSFLAAAMQQTANEANKSANALEKFKDVIVKTSERLEKLNTEKAYGLDALPQAERDQILRAAGGNEALIPGLMTARRERLSQSAFFDLNPGAKATQYQMYQRDRQFQRQTNSGDTGYGFPEFGRRRRDWTGFSNEVTAQFPLWDQTDYLRRQRTTAQYPKAASYGSRASLSAGPQSPYPQSPIFNVSTLNVMPNADQVRLYNILNGGGPF